MEGSVKRCCTWTSGVWISSGEPGPSCRDGGRGARRPGLWPASTTPHVFRIRKLELTLRFCQPPPQLSPALPIMHRGRNELPWASARSLPSAVIYRKQPMIYGPVISQWSCSLSFARPPDLAATPSQVGEMRANHTLWGLLNRRSCTGGGGGGVSGGWGVGGEGCK